MTKYTNRTINAACMLLSARACGTGLSDAWRVYAGTWPWCSRPHKFFILAQRAFDLVYMDPDYAKTDGAIIAAEAEARLRCGWLP